MRITQLILDPARAAGILVLGRGWAETVRAPRERSECV